MSGPNTNYDPVRVSTLDASAIETMVSDAVVAFAAASSIAELKSARLAHTGEKSPLALANREIGALPPAQRAESLALAYVRDPARSTDLQFGLVRRALMAAMRGGAALGTHDHDGHLLLIHAHAPAPGGNGRG